MLTELIEASDALCAVLAESLHHPKHAATIQPARSKLTKMLVRRFRRQRGNVLDKAARWLPWLAQRYSEAEADEQTRKATLTHTIRVNIDADGALSGTSAADIAVFDAAVGAAASGAVKTISVDLAIKLATDQAKTYTAKWLTTRGFKKLAADVDNTTRENIASAVAETFTKGGSYDDAIQAIKDAFADASDRRADLIARTELADVYNAAMLDSAKESGAEFLKQWNCDGPDPCDECIANEDQGPIELDDDFQSGDAAPSLHPHCFCSLSFVKRSEEE